MATPKKQKSLVATLGTLILAGIAWFAQSQGWIKGDNNTSQSGEIAGADSSSATAESATAESATAESATVGSVTAESPAAESGETVFGMQRATYELGLEKIADAKDNGLSDVLVECAGTVAVLLADDLVGSKHQKWLLDLETGTRLLFAHNIDQAQRVPLKVGDPISFFGEYEWNDKGGVVHWTHRAHGGNHPDGWIRHKGKLYW